MRIAVITAPRKVSYLRQTLDSLVENMISTKAVEVGVFSDSLPCGLDLPRGVQSWFRTQPELDRIPALGLFGTSNLQRALRWSAAGSKYACVFEDDILFAKDWLARAIRIADAIELANHPWCVSLQHFLPIENFTQVGSVGSDLVFRWNEIVPLFGSQGYFMRSTMANAIADAFEQKIQQPMRPDARRWWMMDEGMIRFCTVHKMFKFYVPKPCLVQHVGAESSVFEGVTLDHNRTTRYFSQE